MTTTPTTAGALPTTTFTYVRDPAGNVTSVQGPGGTTVYGYDEASQLTSLIDPAGGPFEIGYDGAGRRTSLTRPNGVDDTNVFDLAGNVTSMHSSLGASLLARSDYGYDPAGRRESLTSLLGTSTFGYDGASQLTAASFPAATGLPAEQYAYDLAGNRTASATPPVGPLTYDDADRLVEDAERDLPVRRRGQPHPPHGQGDERQHDLHLDRRAPADRHRLSGRQQHDAPLRRRRPARGDRRRADKRPVSRSKARRSPPSTTPPTRSSPRTCATRRRRRTHSR